MVQETLDFVSLWGGVSAWLTVIGIDISAFQTTETRDCSRKKKKKNQHYVMSFWVLISHCGSERGWATVGIVALLKDRMRGGGMQPLIIIRPIYCEMSSRQKSKRKASLGKVLFGHHSPSYHACESHSHHALHSGPSLSQQHSWTTMIVQCLFPILHYYCQYAELEATWLSDGDRPGLKKRGGGAVCEAFWLPSHNCQPCINT